MENKKDRRKRKRKRKRTRNSIWRLGVLELKLWVLALACFACIVQRKMLHCGTCQLENAGNYLTLIELPSRMSAHSLPFISEARKAHEPSLNKNPLQTIYVSGFLHSPMSYQPLIRRRLSSRHTGLSLVPFVAKNTESGEEDNRALETVLKFYTAIKNNNIHELSDIIGDECRCVSNFISFSQPFHGKQQVLDFFSYLITSLGNNIEFVVRPTLHDGMSVGVSWRLEWKTTHVPLGKGFSFHICHVYQGKVVLRNVEMFIEPLLHIEPFRLKIMGYVMTVLDKMGSYAVFEGDAKRALYILLTLFLVAALLFTF
ncbi:hypothetical protein L1049_009824 [Liquidambar formosana]|uniref:SnoaL-like domain-containing protein n=1 Tax=Liquidambar formosana TaxID=63359 RepID=A0AAP0N9Y3_LIQFO